MRTPFWIILFCVYYVWGFPKFYAFASNPFHASVDSNNIHPKMTSKTIDKGRNARYFKPLIRNENGKDARYSMIYEDNTFLSSAKKRVKPVKGHSATTNVDRIKQEIHLHKMNKNNYVEGGSGSNSNKKNSGLFEPNIMHIREGAPCKIDKVLQVADCSNLKLDTVPQGLPPGITSLKLSHNNLNSNSLTNKPFRRYGQLKDLLLDFNNITSLPNYAFVGLKNLRILNLHSNSIIMNSALNWSMAFIPLKSTLYELVFNNNTKNLNVPGLVYPDKALSHLVNLQTLEIDGLPHATFGYNFQFMNKITKLSLEGYYTGQCNISLQNDTFKYLPTIRHLILSDCKIYRDRVEIKAFEPLTQLELLEISYNFHLGLDGLGKLMHGQRNNQNLKKIIMKYIVERYEPCIILYQETLKNFRNLSLEAVDANHNNIEMIEYGAIDYLPKTLKRVNLTRNNIMFGAYWKQLKDMPMLESLDLDGYDQAHRLPAQTPPEDIHCPFHRQGEHRPKKRSPERYSDTYPGPLFLQLPPNLINLTMRSYSLSYKIDAMVFDFKNKLNKVNLHGNYLPVLNGPISGLDNLEYLDITSSYVREISSKFFQNLKSLKKVDLSGNMLGESLAKKSTIFYSDSLEELNIGSNGISKLNDDMFKSCSSLSTLILSDNRITTINSAMDNLPNLSRLLVSRNDLSTLPKTLRDHFSGKTDAFIDMTFNPIHCDCNNIDFLEWVVRTKIFGNSYTNYFCVYTHGKYNNKRMENGYDEELKILMNQCADNTELLLCVISASVAFFFALIGVIIFRFRWTMRYWYYVAKYMLSNKSNNACKEEFEYDLFVCYCHQDNNFITEELEPRLGQESDVKLLLQDQCFQAGHEKAENILMAVRQSSKTLVVMSKSMLDSALCNYALQMARQESISTGRTVLVILFLEEIPKDTMSLDMVNYIRSNVIVTYPIDDPDHQKEFWYRLARDLKSS